MVALAAIFAFTNYLSDVGLRVDRSSIALSTVGMRKSVRGRLF